MGLLGAGAEEIAIGCRRRAGEFHAKTGYTRLVRALLVTAVVVVSCSKAPPQPAQRDCAASLSVAPGEGVERVSVVGEWSGFVAEPMTRGDDGTFTWKKSLAARDYGYRFQLPDAGAPSLDPSNHFGRWVGQTEHSRLRVAPCEPPLLQLESFDASPQGALTVQIAARRGATGAGLEAPVATLDGEPLAGSYDAATGALTLERTGLGQGKHTVVVTLKDVAGAQAERLLLPFWVEPEPFQWDDATLYFTFTDRFRNGDPANDAPVPGVKPLANFQGGDFAGIRQAIEDGYFDSLGVNALWLSPPNLAPDGGFPGSHSEQYTGYHGYWPASGRESEPRFGSVAELRALTQAAHARGMRVIVDVVLNHVHEAHPLFQAHSRDDWFHVSGACTCGTNNCSFDARPLDCWFAPYLPDVEWRTNAAAEAFLDDADWWLEAADLDGYRIDAVKHFERSGSRGATGLLRRLGRSTGTALYAVGETFTGSDGRAQIASYLGPTGLDGQFDFPLYWPIIDAFARGQSLALVSKALTENQTAYPQGTINSPFLGNHDVPRFISIAAGQIENDSGAQAWFRPPAETVTDPLAFARARFAFTTLLTIPGVPLIYYGDELGLPGAGDPDNRRFMKWSGLSSDEAALRAHVQKLGVARRTSVALRRGRWVPVAASDDLLVYRRPTNGADAIVIINRGPAREVAVPLDGWAAQRQRTWRDVLGGAEQMVGGASVTLSVGEQTSAVWLPK